MRLPHSWAFVKEADTVLPLSRRVKDTSYVPCAAPSVYLVRSCTNVASVAIKQATTQGGYLMSYRGSTGAFPFVVALMLSMGGAWAADDAKYPNWKGHWDPINPRLGGQAIKFDPTKAWGPAQQAPLTAEYQKVHEESMADQANGGLGNYPTATCHPGGMPRIMSIGEYEYIVEPETTYILIGGEDHYRRIFTDERPWPTDIEPSYAGYSIGNWIDEDGDGRFNVLEV